ncbi:cytochrome P450 [Halalkalibacter alkalisediminis]|uniref:Cytochrome P450 n=1 Tax=Halalkalibacter alkalisediminis TaxID=935616 RepID=A0ABV6N9W3_9BACI|nr:cytochrome P450 [Halalkalibacter alkalisediminis]
MNTRVFVDDPYHFYDALRASNPISKGTLLKYPGWYVTGYDEAVAILKDSRFLTRSPLPQTRKKYKNLKTIQKDMLLFKNPPNHTRLRMLVGKAFTPRVLEQYRTYMEETVHQLLDQVQEKKTMDVVSDLAFPLASFIIAKIIGVPEKDRHLFRIWAVTLIETIDFTRSINTLANGDHITERLVDYFKELIKERRQSPKVDLISMLINEKNGDNLTDDELVSTCILLVIAGHETTVNLISNSVYCLLNHPKQLKMLKETPALMENAVEEFLRYESPTQMTARFASEDIKISNHLIKKGEQVYLLLGAVNRDPKKFFKPNQLDITRNPNPHLAFGYGIHFCLGSTLARLEAQTVLRVFLRRIPDFQFASSELKWRKLIGFRALQELPIHFN